MAQKSQRRQPIRDAGDEWIGPSLRHTAIAPVFACVAVIGCPSLASFRFDAPFVSLSKRSH
jgi:hypothetical protein